MSIFDQAINRLGYSLKWDEPLYPVDNSKPFAPMWIADMDFPTPDCVLESLRKRLLQPTFGYCDPLPAFGDAIVSWNLKRRGNTEIRPEFILYQNSVVGALVSAIKTLTAHGEPVLVNTPNYTGFTYGLSDAGRRFVPSSLVQDEDDIFRMDFEDMEKKIVSENIKAMLLCSPHNPTGRVWTKQELLQVSMLCEKYNVFIISDEIWADFVYKPAHHIATATLTPYTRSHTITTYSCSKTFNLASLRVAYSVVYDDKLRSKYHKKSLQNHYNVHNTLSEAALIGGYTGGEPYLDKLLDYIYNNMTYADNFISNEIPLIKSYIPEGTYTMWLDFTKTRRSDEENIRLLGTQGVILSPSSEYNGRDWFRMNMACPMSQVKLALEGIKRAMN